MDASAARKNAEAFLADRGIALGDVAELIRPLGEGEGLVLGGSVAEGFANDDSDVDLLLLGGYLGADGIVFQDSACEISTLLHEKGLEISVEAWRSEDLDRVARRMATNVEMIRAPETLRRAELIGHDSELRLLHRLRTGVVLGNREVVEAWRERLFSDFLPAYLTLFCLNRHFGTREDALAEWMGGHRRSCTHLFRESALGLAGALLAASGETHPNVRWRVRLLERERDALPDGVGDRLLDWICAPPFFTSDGEVEEALARCDEILREIFARRPEIVAPLGRLVQIFPLRTDLAAVPQRS
jgi:predicted nucleotidyltransferase